jgi:hypothetical protein
MGVFVRPAILFPPFGRIGADRHAMQEAIGESAVQCEHLAVRPHIEALRPCLHRPVMLQRVNRGGSPIRVTV